MTIKIENKITIIMIILIMNSLWCSTVYSQVIEDRKTGTKEWYLNGKYHRLDGTKEWYLNGKLHREDGPAVEWADGTKDWYFNGQLHRLDGPAREWADGDREWYLNGKQYTEGEYMFVKPNKK